MSELLLFENDCMLNDVNVSSEKKEISGYAIYAPMQKERTMNDQ